MSTVLNTSSFFSDICITQCKGRCCDPWWGIISYAVHKEHGLADIGGFKGELIKGIEQRAQRIVAGYVTNENPARPLFTRPVKYNVTVRDMKADANTLTVNILALFAFRCNFLSQDKTCTIHPAFMNGTDIRPPHCGFMGSLNARPNEKGYCRIIHAAETSSGHYSRIRAAIDMEKETSDAHYREGFDTAEEAADAVMKKIAAYCSRYAAHLATPAQKGEPGRNEPCLCGSGRKYKKCHGR